MLKIYGIKNCDTMKKAFAWLDSHGIAYEFIDYKKAGIAADHLPDWAKRAGWQTLLNTRGQTWCRLPQNERENVDESKALTLMAASPTLIKRPVLDDGKTLLVGFDEARYSTLK